MKNLFIYLFILIMYVSYSNDVMGQLLVSIRQVESGSPCPGEEVTYYINCDNNHITNITNLEWEIEGGIITSNGDVNDNDCKVVWDDTTVGNLKIGRICVGFESGATLCENNVELDVSIKSINDETPVFSNPTTAIDLEHNSAISYEINSVEYGDDTYASEYQWNIPENWISGGVTSTGNNIYMTTSCNITVIPDDCTAGEIRVWAVNTKCSGKSNSDTTAINILREYPNFEITGSYELCLTGSYSINTTPNYSVSWIPCSGMNIVSGQGTNQITVSKATNSDNCSLQAVVTHSSCSGNPEIFTKNVKVGIPDYTKIDISLDGGYLLACDYTSAEADYDGTAGIDGYEWFMPDANNWEIEEESGAGPDNKYVEIDYWEDPAPYYEVIYVRARNACGWSYWAHKTFSVIDNCGGFFMMVISPNPADTYVELSFIEDSTPILREHVEKNQIKFKKKNRDSEVEEFLIQILDKNATVRKSVQTNKLKINIPTNDLEPSTYFIHVTIGEETYKQQLIIK